MNANGHIKPLRIFLVENHDDTLRWLRLYLEDSGHTVIAARTLAEAVAGLPAADCDVLISDIGLPDGMGWNLLEQVTLPRPVFPIAMSGFGSNASHAQTQAAGFRHHLLKPFRTADLDKLLEEAAAVLPAHYGR